MSTTEICAMSATEMAMRIRAREVSAVEVLEAHLRQIELINPSVNAIVTVADEQAREAARMADQTRSRGPLHGVPVAIKDLHRTAGIRTTYGSRLYCDFVPDEDEIHVARIRQAGGIIIGKTNTSEFGAGSQTFNEVFGKTLNPWDLTKTCGGSSGGSAVSLATHMAALADGSDNGGSLRNPAAFCNVVGLRPAPGRVPVAAQGNAWSTLSVNGPMARTVSDVALLLSVIAGSDPRCPISIEESSEQFTRPLARNLRGTRVAWFDTFGGTPFDPSIENAVHAQRKVFESLGCTVETAEPDLSGAAEAYEALRLWGFVSAHAEDTERHPELFKDTILESVAAGRKLTAQDIGRALATKSLIFERMRQFLQTYEYFILPSTEVPPFDVNRPWVTEINGVPMRNYIEWMRCCWMITMTECPAISVPCGFTPEGLPVGLQIVGRHRNEWSVLQIAYAFEQATKYGTTAAPAPTR